LSGGTFSGTLSSIPTGGPYLLEVRARTSSNVVLVTEQGSNNFDVGGNALFIGQSNTVGLFPVAAMYHTGDENYTAHSATSEYTDGSWTDPTFDGSVAFGNTLREKLSIPIGMLNYAVNSSSIDDWETGDTNYTNAIAAVNAAGGVEVIFFGQGETDVGMAEATYDANLDTLITDLRGETNIPSDCPIIVSLLSRYTDTDLTDANWENIRKAQRTATTNNSNAYLIEQFDTGISTFNVHWDAIGYAKNGRKAAEAYLYHLDEVSYYTGPALSYSLPDSTSIRVHLFHTGGTDFTPTSGIEGFSLTGSGLTITSVDRTDADDIDITVTGDTANLTALRLGYGLQGSLTEANFPRDNVALDLPDSSTIGQTLTSGEIEYEAADSTNPVTTITTPTSSATYSAGWTISGSTLTGSGDSSTLTVGGTVTDAGTVSSVTWANAGNSTSGTATGTTSWTASIALAEGSNVITVTGTDRWGNTHDDIITVTYDGTVSTTPSPTYGDGDVITLCYEIPTYTSGQAVFGGYVEDFNAVKEVGTYCVDIEITDYTSDLEVTAPTGFAGTINLNPVQSQRKTDGS